MTVAYSDPWLTIHGGDCREVMATLEPESVHCVVTSPPYWGLRDYGVGGQLGLEPTPEQYVENMVAVFREVRRVLRKDGTVWLNVDDRIRDGASLLIPERLVIALVADGWRLATTIIWAKGGSLGPFVGTALPDGSGRRPDRSHEPVFLLVKSHDYYYDADAVREDSDPAQVAHNQRYAKVYDVHTDKAGSREPGNVNHVGIHSRPSSDGKRGLRTVWQVNVTPYPGAHFAVFPEKLVEPCVKASRPDRPQSRVPPAADEASRRGRRAAAGPRRRMTPTKEKP